MSLESRMSKGCGQFSHQVDGFSEQEWHDLVEAFDDAHLCQTWSYGAARWGPRSLSHLVLKCDGRVVGAA